MILSFAYKNILRNKRRTLLSGLTLFLVAFFIIIMMAFEYGELDGIQSNIIHHETGNVRIRNPLYSENERINPLSLYIDNTKEVLQKLETMEDIKYAEAKIKTTAVIYHNQKSEVGNVVGVDFSTCNFFNNKNNIVKEGVISPLALLSERKLRQSAHNVVITSTFSERFDLHVNNKFTFMVQTANNGTNAATGIVKAVINFADSDYSNRTFFVNLYSLSDILRMNCNATEILVVSNKIFDNNFSNKLANIIEKEFPDLEIKAWTKINLYYSIFEIMDFIYFILAVIFFTLAATVIFNNTMMSVLERKKEIGTLLSIGIKPGTVRIIFLLETIFVSAIFTLLGCLLGAMIVGILKHIGINLNYFGYNNMEGASRISILYPSLSFGRYIEFFFIGFFSAVIASLIPSRMALKVQPAEALRTEN